MFVTLIGIISSQCNFVSFDQIDLINPVFEKPRPDFWTFRIQENCYLYLKTKVLEHEKIGDRGSGLHHFIANDKHSTIVYASKQMVWT